MSLEARVLSRSTSTEDMVSDMTHVGETCSADEACSSVEAPVSYLNLLDMVNGSLALQGHLSISTAGASRRTAAMSVNGPFGQPSVNQATPFAYVAAHDSFMDVDEACPGEGPWVVRSIAPSRAASLQSAWSPAPSRWGSGALDPPSVPPSRLTSSSNIPPSRLGSSKW